MPKTTKDEIPVEESQQATGISQQITESRALLGKQMSANLIAIVELTHTPIPHMQVDEHGVFHEIQSN
ncbi:hypothetical protein [Acinetobacter variabilis]|uniref:hypothetical protein n=1 Tax=Acinetobacter variabilis TaxID=70346 RepID=UPI0028A010F4|nr:hypothetical protein [Acinetobacter variabilis]